MSAALDRILHRALIAIALSQLGRGRDCLGLR